MGRFDELPVTGHRTGIAVIPINGTYCMKPETTVLNYIEKSNECIIKVIISEYKTLL